MATTPAPSNYPNAFLNGVTVREVPITISNPGKVWWLNNSSVLAPGGSPGSDTNPGTYTRPFSTLAGAVANTGVTASRGDIICVMPGHAESIASSTALALSVAGIAIVGLGYGTMRPTFTLTTANTATITVSANNVSIQNCIFVANFLNVAALFTLTTAKGFCLDNCQIRDTSAILNFVNVISTSTTTAANEDLSVTRNQVILSTAAGAAKLVSFLGTHDRVTIADNYYNAVTTGTGAVMPIATGKVVTNLQLLRNIFVLVQTTGVTTGILITTDGSTNSGMIANNLIQGLDATTEILVTASSGFRFSQNFYSGVADTSGYLLPVADA